MQINNRTENGLLLRASGFVKELFEKKLPDWALYHNLQHTFETVDGCIEIGKGSQIDKDELEILVIAAWFHDTGFTESVIGHEQKSSEIAVLFLKQNNTPPEFINKVKECILATSLSVKPENLLEEIICDSDLMSLGREDYFAKNDMLKKEIELREQHEITVSDWLLRSYQFLNSHKYYTEYAKNSFGPGLQKNKEMLKRQLDKSIGSV